MNIISTTLAGGNREHLICDALSSVENWVDGHLLIDTGTAEAAIQRAENHCIKPVFIRKWNLDSAADARNACLSFATELGADYAVILDTDERIRNRGDSPREVIWQNRDVDYWLAYNIEHRYSKVRVIKLPPNGRYSGHTHEAFCSDGKSAFFKYLCFEEIPKDPAYYPQYAKIILERMERQIENEPNQSRWYYFKGDCLFVLKEYDRAIAAFEKCYELSNWNEEAAWSCFRIAGIHLTRQQWDKAIRVAMKGLAAHPGIGELNWVAAVAALNSGFPTEATYFAKLAVAQGRYDVEGFGNEVVRRGCMEPLGLYEGPYEVLEKAAKSLGDEGKAAIYHTKWLKAKALHEMETRSG